MRGKIEGIYGVLRCIVAVSVTSDMSQPREAGIPQDDHTLCIALGPYCKTNPELFQFSSASPEA